MNGMLKYGVITKVNAIGFSDVPKLYVIIGPSRVAASLLIGLTSLS